MTIRYTLGELAQKVNGTVLGDAHLAISGVASLHGAHAGDISFIEGGVYKSAVASSAASAYILREQDIGLTDKDRLVVDQPRVAFAQLLAVFHPPPKHAIGIAANVIIGTDVVISPTCRLADGVVIGNRVQIADDVVIQAGCVIEDDVSIGRGTQLDAHVIVQSGCVIGEQCHLHAGVVIGSDGFGYTESKVDATWDKMRHIGGVTIGNAVDIGANSTIDRGLLDDTVIEQGVKIDNLVHIAHNCVIGANTVIAACAGIAGSAKIGRGCKIGGAAMIAGHLSIADRVIISPGTLISRSISVADRYTGLAPFQRHTDWLKSSATLRRINNLKDRIEQLEQLLSQFTSSKGHKP